MQWTPQTMGSKGGKLSRRTLTSEEARKMNEAKAWKKLSKNESRKTHIVTIQMNLEVKADSMDQAVHVVEENPPGVHVHGKDFIISTPKQTIDVKKVRLK